MKKFKHILLTLMLALCAGSVHAVDVTLTTDEGTVRTAAISRAEQNLARLLTEINRAQKQGSAVSVKGQSMDDFSKKSLLRLWDVTPFYCDDEEVVDRLWLFSNGTMMVSHIPLIITPKDDTYGLGTYQEAVVEFDKTGNITDFRFALDHDSVGRDPGSRADEHDVAGDQLIKTDRLDLTIGPHPVGLVGQQSGERIQRAGGLAQRSHLQPVTEQHDHDEEGELPPEVQVEAADAERGQRTGDEGHGDGHGDQQHHPGLAGAQLRDRAGEERPAPVEEDDRAEHRGDPAGSGRQGVAEQVGEH